MMNSKPITDLMREIENGQLVQELTGKCFEIVRAARETRKPGKLKITLEFKPTGKGTVTIEADYDATIPEHDRPSTTFFMTPEGTLLRDDPSQPRLPLREVIDETSGEIREVAS